MSEFQNRFTFVFIMLLFVVDTSVAQQPKTKNRNRATAAKFALWDQDGDGSISPPEMPTPNRTDFEEADLDADGALSSSEFSKYWRDYGRKVTARESISDQVRIIENITYVKTGHVRQKLDIFLPKASDPSQSLPLVIWIHGGGWKNGNKSALVGQQILLRHGFALASINYRLVSHASFPAQIHDCKSAVRFLRKNAKRYGIDPNRIGVWGSSAGGHLAALLGTTNGMKELEAGGSQEDVSSHVRAVCDYFGPSNMQTIVEPNNPNDPADQKRVKTAIVNIGNLLGGPVKDNRTLAKLASPIEHVSSDDAPFLIIHGDADSLVPIDQSTTLHQRLSDAGVDSELIIVPGGTHSFYGTDEHLSRVVSFFQKTLSP